MYSPRLLYLFVTPKLLKWAAPIALCDDPDNHDGHTSRKDIIGNRHTAPPLNPRQQPVRTICGAMLIRATRCRSGLDCRIDLPVVSTCCNAGPLSNRVWRHDARQARAQFQKRLFFSLSAICCLLPGLMTAIWCGEAGIPSNVSVGEDDCSWTSPDPRTEIWCGLMGKPATSYCGSSPPEAPTARSTLEAPDRLTWLVCCCANARPVTIATIPRADSATFVVNRVIFLSIAGSSSSLPTLFRIAQGQLCDITITIMLSKSLR